MMSDVLKSLMEQRQYQQLPWSSNLGGQRRILGQWPCSSGSLVIERTTPLTQTSVFTDNMPVPMKSFERSLDKLTEITQEQNAEFALSVTPQSANTVLAGPTSGSPALMVPRALVSADIPNNAANTTGNAATATYATIAGSIPTGTGCPTGNTIANGCTGATTAAGALTNLGALPLSGGTMSTNAAIAFQGTGAATTLSNLNGASLTLNNTFLGNQTAPCFTAGLQISWLSNCQNPISSAVNGNYVTGINVQNQSTGSHAAAAAFWGDSTSNGQNTPGNVVGIGITPTTYVPYGLPGISPIAGSGWVSTIGARDLYLFTDSNAQTTHIGTRVGNTMQDYAAFGPTSIAFPGAAPATGTDCLQIANTTGIVTNTGSPCGGGGGSGTVSSSTVGYFPQYTGTTTVSGVSQATAAATLGTAGGYTIPAGVVNDACPSFVAGAGALHTHHVAGGVCVTGTPTDNCSTLTTLGSTSGQYYFPTDKQNYGGWTYTSCTPVISTQGTVWTASGVNSMLNAPVTGQAVIVTDATANIDGLDINSSPAGFAATCSGTGPGVISCTNTGTNGLASGNAITLNNFTSTMANLNTTVATVSATGLTSTTFQFTTTATVSGSASGNTYLNVVTYDVSVNHLIFISVNPSTGLVSTSAPSTGYCINGTGSAGHVGPGYYGYNNTVSEVDCLGYSNNIYLLGYATTIVDDVRVLGPSGGSGAPGITFGGAGTNSNYVGNFQYSGYAGAYCVAFGDSTMNTGGGSGNYVTVGDLAHCNGVQWGITGQIYNGFAKFRELENSTGPSVVGQQSQLTLDFGGWTAGNISTGSIVKTGTYSRTAVHVSGPWVPLLATETLTATSTSTTGGSLGAGTYYYKLAGGDYNGNTTLPSGELTCTLGSTGGCQVFFTYPSTVNGYPCIYAYRGTSSGTEQLIPTQRCNQSTNFTDDGTLGTPSGAVPSVATYYHPFLDLGSSAQGVLYGAPQYIQAQTSSSAVQRAPWTVIDQNHEPFFGYQPCTKVPYGTAVTPTNISMDGECIFTPGTQGNRSSWYMLLKNTSGTVVQSPDLGNTTGSGAIVQATAPTVAGLTDTGNTSLNNLTVTGTCSGCTGTAYPPMNSISTNWSTPSALAYTGTVTGPAYTSGITGTGATGTTCIVTFSNGGTATVAATATNTWGSGATTVITAVGSATYTASPTTGTVSNGTATACAGTPVMAMPIGIVGTNAFVTLGAAITVPSLVAGACMSYTRSWARTGPYNAAQNMQWNLAGTTFQGTNNDTYTGVNWLHTSTFTVCNQAGSTTAQNVFVGPLAVSAGSVYPGVVGQTSLNFGTSQTLTPQIKMGTTDYYFDYSGLSLQ